MKSSQTQGIQNRHWPAKCSKSDLWGEFAMVNGDSNTKQLKHLQITHDMKSCKTVMAKLRKQTAKKSHLHVDYQ